ncbi:MAG: hypothetical protein ACFCUU_07720 [Cyclobacteriaceae bacterium]
MPKIGTLDFSGISGHKYTFNVYPFNHPFKEKEAVYFVTHRTVRADGSVEHALLFVGEAKDISKAFDPHPLQHCFDREVANCICVHWEDHEVTREKLLADLLNHYHPPCNYQ